MRLFVKKESTWIDRRITGILIRPFYINRRYRFFLWSSRKERDIAVPLQTSDTGETAL